MNVERIQAAIKLMEKADNLYMPWYQTASELCCGSIEQLHACGNKACFAGYLALSEEFQEAGGKPDLSCEGSPIYKNRFGAGAVSEYLEISPELGRSLVYGDVYSGDLETAEMSYSHFYEKLWHEVTAEDVIEKLNAILRGELQ